MSLSSLFNDIKFEIGYYSKDIGDNTAYIFRAIAGGRVPKIYHKEYKPASRLLHDGDTFEDFYNRIIRVSNDHELVEKLCSGNGRRALANAMYNYERRSFIENEFYYDYLL